jgi:hypothetical protein
MCPCCPQTLERQGPRQCVDFGAQSHGPVLRCLRFVPSSRTTTQDSLTAGGQPLPSRLSSGRFQQKVSNSIYLISSFPFYGFSLAQSNYDPSAFSAGGQPLPSRLSSGRFQQKVSNSIYLISSFPFYGFSLAQSKHDPSAFATPLPSLETPPATPDTTPPPLAARPSAFRRGRRLETRKSATKKYV